MAGVQVDPNSQQVQIFAPDAAGALMPVGDTAYSALRVITVSGVGGGVVTGAGVFTAVQLTAAQHHVQVSGAITAHGTVTAQVGTVTAVGGVPSNATTTAYAASLLVKAAAGTFFGLAGYNSGPAQWIQMHDAASLPADAAVPQVIVRVDALSNFAIDYGLKGRAFSTGIVVSNSTTGPTKTIGAADCWFDCQYT